MTLKEAFIDERVFIKAHGPSNGAKALARELGCKVLRTKNSKYKPRKDDVIINWGFSGQDYAGPWIINVAQNIEVARNKLWFLEVMQDADFHDNIVDWTIYREIAEQQLREHPKDFIYCRKTVTGHGGAGMVIAKTVEELVDAPLYTVGVVKAREYRAHVSNDGIFHLQQKKRRQGENKPDGLIKNYSHGWVFTTENITPVPDETENLLTNMLRELKLDFAAFDFMVKDGNVIVLEANTAPGLEGTTIKKYSEAICRAIIGRNVMG